MAKPVSPVFERVKHKEIAMNGAAFQTPVQALHSEGRITTRWQLSAKEREAVAAGADIVLTQCNVDPTKYPPTKIQILDKDVDDRTVLDTLLGC